MQRQRWTTRCLSARLVLAACLLCLALLLHGCHAAAAPIADGAPTPAYQVVLIGSHSSLARKYLWQALVEIRDALYPARLLVVGVSRGDTASNRAKAEEIIRRTRCGSGAHFAPHVNDSDPCARLQDALLADVSFATTDGEAAYQVLAAALMSDAARGDASRPAAADANQRYVILGRLFYFAVAPDLVAHILTSLIGPGGPGLLGTMISGAGGFPTNIIVEKPVGRDEGSAGAMLKELSALVGPAASLLYIDHYLGKTGVSLTAGVRMRMMRDERWVHLARRLRLVEAAMLEDEDLAGRRATFNEHGIVRDTMQSHLTQFLVASLLMTDDAWSPASRLDIIGSLGAPDRTAQMGTDLGSQPHRFGLFSGYEEARLDGAADPNATISAGGTCDATAAAAVAAASAVADSTSAVSGAASSACACALPRVTHVPTDRRPLLGPTRPNISDSDAWRKVHGRTPSLVEVWGANFSAPTAAQVLLSVMGGVPVVATAGKALGKRSAYVRHTYMLPVLAPCGPVTITYQLHGKLELPAGVALPELDRPGVPPMPESVRAALGLRGAAVTGGGGSTSSSSAGGSSTTHTSTRTGGPAVMFTGWCLDSMILPDPRGVLSGSSSATAQQQQEHTPGLFSHDAGWAWEWDVWGEPGGFVQFPRNTSVSSSACGGGEKGGGGAGGVAGLSNGIIIAVPHVQPWKSRILSDFGDTLADADATATLDTSNHAAASTLSRLVESIGTTGSDAYRSLISAGLLGLQKRFTSDAEIRALWRLWGPVAALGDATAAMGAALHWGDGRAQVDYENRRVGALMTASRSVAKAHARNANMSVFLYAPGDASWLRAVPPPFTSTSSVRGTSATPADAASSARASAVNVTDEHSTSFEGSVLPQHQQQRYAHFSVEAVIVGSNAGDATAQFASDFLALSWATVRGDDDSNDDDGDDDGGQCSCSSAHGDTCSDGGAAAANAGTGKLSATTTSATRKRSSSQAHPRAPSSTALFDVRRHLFHWAADAGETMGPFFDRLSSPDVHSMLPLSAMHVWQTGERDTRPGALACQVCFLVPSLISPLKLEGVAVHMLLHPNVSHVNALSEALFEGRQLARQPQITACSGSGGSCDRSSGRSGAHSNFNLGSCGSHARSRAAASFDLITIQLEGAHSSRDGPARGRTDGRGREGPGLGLLHQLRERRAAAAARTRRPKGVSVRDFVAATGGSDPLQPLHAADDADSSAGSESHGTSTAAAAPAHHPIFVSSGLGLGDAIEDEALAVGHMSTDERNALVAAADAAGSALLDALSGSAPVDPISGKKLRLTTSAANSSSRLPRRPLLPYRGEVDISVSEWAISQSRHVWVMVPESRLRAAAEAARPLPTSTSVAGAAHGGSDDGPLYVGLDAAGVIAPTSHSDGAGAAGCGDSVRHGGLPLDVLDDIADTIPRNAPFPQSVRVYFVKGL